MKIVCIIPARLASTRLPNKPLLEIAGLPLILHVYNNIEKISIIDEVIVATDDKKIVEVVNSVGGNAMLTPKELSSGTDRVAFACQGKEADLIINVQGDEPFIKSEMIETGIKPFLSDDNVKMGSLKTRIKSAKELFDPNVVKVVTDKNDNALYFSRAPIPYDRDKFAGVDDPSKLNLGLDNNAHYKHLGIYFFRPDFLNTFSRMPASDLEKKEKLEQLRVLENGHKIVVPTTEHDSIGVDTKPDLLKVRNIFEDMGSRI
ncbi:3-deoxy-manno-octulosonate cytidylyltransferase [Thermodesulfobacteriota bacterium]